MRVTRFFASAFAAFCAVAAPAGAQPFPFQVAAERGMVFLAPSHTSGENDDIISHVREVSPGIVDGFGYLWGGPTNARIAYAAGTAAKLRGRVPQILTVGAWSEGVRPDYDETLQCGGSIGDRRFTAAEVTSGRRQGRTSVWIDMAKPGALLFYDCVGQMYLDRGFDILRFEAPTLVLRYASDPERAAAAYRKIGADMRAYAARAERTVYFIGDPDLARYLRLDAVLVPSRFYHTTLASALRYQNRISRPGIGVGYSYALSPLIVRDTVGAVPAGTKVFFAVDNWDPSQDDLRRFMEVDRDNRRYLIEASARNAQRGGAAFVPPLDHCSGCVPREAVVDPCEVLRNDSTEYNAVRCGDLPVIDRALHHP